METGPMQERTGANTSVAIRSGSIRYDDAGGVVNRRRFEPGFYTVGLVCALPIERTAIEAMLDEEHSPLVVQSEQDTNAYTLGRIGPHNVVIAGLPNDQYGLNNAAIVATNMLWSFPSIIRRLIIGIGGGAPDFADMRLGDVVVSSQVIQYDFGRAISDGQLQTTSIPTCPPQALLNAVAKLRAAYNRVPSQIPTIIRSMIMRYPRMVDYQQPTSEDILFEHSYDHVLSSPGTCDVCD